MAIGYQRQYYYTTGTKQSLGLDPSISPFTAQIAVTITGTVSYKLQWSLDPGDVADADALWFDSTEIPAATSASKTSILTAPVSRIRLVIDTATGATLALQVQQGMSIN